MDTDTPQIAAPDIFLLVSVIPLGDAHPGTPWHKKILALPAPLCLSGIVDTSISSKNLELIPAPLGIHKWSPIQVLVSLNALNLLTPFDFNLHAT